MQFSLVPSGGYFDCLWICLFLASSCCLGLVCASNSPTIAREVYYYIAQACIWVGEM